MSAPGGSLLVLVAHSGRTLQLDVQPGTRVDAVQHALVSFTGIPVADQIVMYQGARLDPLKPLGLYRLPVDPSHTAAEDHPVFLYCRSYLKPGAALPPPEAMAPLQVQVPPLAEVNLAHPLHSAASPLVRALPDYERHFQHHLATTRAYWDVAQARLQRCRQLLSEQEVQARAADAARANVEAHYNYILQAYQGFLDKYNAQHAAHALLLSTFPSDLAALEAIVLHPSLQQSHPQQQQQHSQQPAGADPRSGAAGGGAGGAGAGAATPATAAGPRRLSDLYPLQRLRDWADTCGRSHASFAAKVSELEALFQLLRKDVEGLFMQAPSVDLDALGRQMAEHEGLLDEHSSMVQVLSKDLRTVRALVEDVVRQLGASGGAGAPGGAAGTMRGGALHDAAAAMEAIHETHRNRVLPRLAQLDSQLAAFTASAEASKVAMSRDVLGQLQRISGQQSRIRDMKNKLAAFNEVLGRQEAAFAELRVVHRLPSAYRALLAEAVRRAAWHELYCGQAGRLAEHMVRFRDKEAARRSSFGSQVARFLPTDLLARAGLSEEPPQCQVTVPPPAVPLITVHISDLHQLSYLDERTAAYSSTLRASAAAASASASASAAGRGAHQPHGYPHIHSSHHTQHHHQTHQHGPHTPHRHSLPGGAHQAPHEPGGPGGPSAAATPHASQHQAHHSPHAMGARTSAGGAAAPFPGTVAVLDSDPAPPADARAALEMENARLRAELANHIAAACIRELGEAAAAAAAGGSGAAAGPSSSSAAAASGPSSADSAAAPPTAAGAGPGSRQSSSGGAAPTPQPASAASPTPSSAATSAAAAAARRDPAELVAAMQRALGMKDDLIRQQHKECAALAARVAAYEERITSLEALLTRQAMMPAACVTGTAAADAGADAIASASAAVAGGSEAGAGPMIGSGAAAGEGRGGIWEPGPGARSAGTTQTAELGGAPGPVPAATTAEEAAASRGADAAAHLAPAGAESPSAAAAAASPFSAPAEQEAETAQAASGLGQRGSELAAAAATEPIEPEAAPTPAVAAAQRGGSGPQVAVRGSSGPQAIPQPPGGLRRGGGGGSGGGVDGADGAADGRGSSPYGRLAVGSLPFATSLPVGSSSVLPGRLDSSPGVGIGLGLALGFGLGPLAEGQAAQQRPSRGESSGDSSSSEGSSSGSESASGSRLSAEGGSGVGSGGAELGAAASGSRGLATGSFGSSLQFQPSWAGGAASGGSTADGGATTGSASGAASGSHAVAEDARGIVASTVAAAVAAVVAAAKAPPPPALPSPPQQGGDLAAGADSADGAGGDGGGDGTGAVEESAEVPDIEDVPDIDEVVLVDEALGGAEGEDGAAARDGDEAGQGLGPPLDICGGIGDGRTLHAHEAEEGEVGAACELVDDAAAREEEREEEVETYSDEAGFGPPLDICGGIGDGRPLPAEGEEAAGPDVAAEAGASSGYESVASGQSD